MSGGPVLLSKLKCERIVENDDSSHATKMRKEMIENNGKCVIIYLVVLGTVY